MRNSSWNWVRSACSNWWFPRRPNSTDASRRTVSDCRLLLRSRGWRRSITETNQRGCRGRRAFAIFPLSWVAKLRRAVDLSTGLSIPTGVRREWVGAGHLPRVARLSARCAMRCAAVRERPAGTVPRFLLIEECLELHSERFVLGTRHSRMMVRTAKPSGNASACRSS